MTGGYNPATPRKNMMPKILATVNTERMAATILKYYMVFPMSVPNEIKRVKTMTVA